MFPLLIVQDNKWDFIIRYKTGSIPIIAQEYEMISEKGTVGHAEFVNEIDYNGKPVNMMCFWEEKEERGRKTRREFQWLINIRITEKNAEKVASAGRKRWNNEIRKRQKNISSELLQSFGQ